MGFRHEIDVGARRVRLIGEDALGEGEAWPAVRAMLGDPAFDPAFDLVVDFSACAASHQRESELMDVARRMDVLEAVGGGGRVAVVLPHDASTERAIRAYLGFRRSKRPLLTFASLAEAEAWLRAPA